MAKSRENGAQGPSRRRPAGRLLLTGFVALWMFVLGVLVGRGTAPVHFDLDEIQRQLAGLKQRVAAEEEQNFKVNLEKLKFFNSLKESDPKPGGPVPQIEAKFRKPAGGVPPAQPPAVEGDPPPGGGVQVEAAAGVPAGAAQADADSGAPGGELFIQVASSKDADATRRLVERLQKAGLPAFSARIELPDKGHWYRVQVGPFTSRPMADEALARLKSQEFNAYLIQR